MGRILLSLLLGCMLTACATDQPLETACARIDEFTIPERSAPAGAATLRARAAPNPFVAALTGQNGARARGLAPDAAAPPETVALILSGGGQWGAYGAGVIDGWSEHGRPRPRIVTGISTGALQATFAFLGPARDADLVRAYQPAREEELAERHGDLFFLRNASSADIAPLKAYAQRFLNPVLEEVAAEARATGRLLLIGAVDARDGRFYMIDMSRMATTLAGAEREQCYTAALLASAAVPVVYRQVTINGDVWMDGGVRRSMFLPELVEQIGQAREAVLAGGDALVPTDGMVWAIKNGTTGIEAKEVPAKLLPTLNRLRQITFDQVEADSLAFARRAAEDHGLTLAVTTADGWDAPPRTPACEGQGPGRGGMLFDPPFMRCLVDYGQRRWQNGQTPWEE
ncbi:MAG: patatin-like phospholipase family protein [Sphingomonadales bacterium]